MPLLRWNDRFLLDVNHIDLQHQHIVELLNLIYDEFKQGASVQTLQSLAEVLIQHTTLHFALEEHWMAKISFPGQHEHIQEHDMFTVRVTEIHESYKEGNNFTLNLLLFLNRWVNNHLNRTNARLRIFLNENKMRRILPESDQANKSN